MKETIGGVLPSKVGIISAANLISIYLCDEVVISDILFERGAEFIDSDYSTGTESELPLLNM